MIELPPRVGRERWRPGRGEAIGLAITAVFMLLLVLIVTFGGRPPEVDDPGPVEVCADSTLQEPMAVAIDAWGRASGRQAQAQFGSSSRLADRFLQGMVCDLYVSGDRRWVHGLAQAELVDESRAVDLARTELVAAVRKGAPRPGGVPELAGPAFPRLAIGAEATPLGEYARAALYEAPEWNLLVPRFVRGSDPRGVRELLRGGQVDVALTTRAEVDSAPDLEVAFAFPESATGEVVYVGAVTARSRRARGAASLLDFLASHETAREAFRTAALAPGVRVQAAVPAPGSGG